MWGYPHHSLSTCLSSWCLQAVRGKDNSPLFLHFSFISAFQPYLFLHFILTHSDLQPLLALRSGCGGGNQTSYKAGEASPKGSRGAAAAWAAQWLHWPSSAQNKTLCSRLSSCLCKGKKKKKRNLKTDIKNQQFATACVLTPCSSPEKVPVNVWNMLDLWDTDWSRQWGQATGPDVTCH